jgi:hypothetical protein
MKGDLCQPAGKKPSKEMSSLPSMRGQKAVEQKADVPRRSWQRRGLNFDQRSKLTGLAVSAPIPFSSQDCIRRAGPEYDFDIAYSASEL